jgi:hypothetical protein
MSDALETDTLMCEPDALWPEELLDREPERCLCLAHSTELPCDQCRSALSTEATS